MLEIAQWLAPAATMIAALMTAANIGTRVTGWGFVIFTLGALAWCVQAWVTHQPNLLWSNGFLALVDAIGIYRWLGHRAKLEDGAKRATERSVRRGRGLFPLHTLEGQALEDRDGTVIAHVVGAMAECASGQISYLVVRQGLAAPSGELRMIAWKDMASAQPLRMRLSREALQRQPIVTPERWPDRPPANATPEFCVTGNGRGEVST